MKIASWIVTALFAAYFVYSLYNASQISTSYGSPATSPAYIFGLFLACSIIPTTLWVITFLLNRNKNKIKLTSSNKKNKIEFNNSNELLVHINNLKYEGLLNDKEYQNKIKAIEDKDKLTKREKQLLEAYNLGILTKAEYEQKKESLYNETNNSTKQKHSIEFCIQNKICPICNIKIQNNICPSCGLQLSP